MRNQGVFDNNKRKSDIRLIREKITELSFIQAPNADLSRQFSFRIEHRSHELIAGAFFYSTVWSYLES
jgi:hypothetical protein